MVSFMYHGRYLLLLMGIFSIYCGFIYNEFFALPMNLFGSRWVYKVSISWINSIHHAEFSIFFFQGQSLHATWNGDSTAYPIGVDPAWKGSKNELIYYNSLKMKLSIIFGVTQVFFISHSAHLLC